MIQLLPYSPQFENELLPRIADFFGYHRSLVETGTQPEEEQLAGAKATIAEWTAPDHALYVITAEKPVGFLHIGYRGEIVAWIEDVYVDPQQRGKGIASQAIALAEERIKQNPAYTAVCMDVAPRNLDALKLYYRLGYLDISLLTVRKELYRSKRDKKIDLFGMEFKY